MEKALGIIGGMGPMATELFYKMLIELTDAVCDQEHLNVLILGHASMPDRTSAILAGDTEEVRQKLYEDALFLQNSGCEAIAITCNTAHYFADRIEAELRIPVINMVKEAAKAVAAKCPGGRAAVLATDGTIKTRLYQDALEKEGLEVYIPTEQAQRLVMHEIYDCIKQGRPADMESWKRIEEELAAERCDTAVIACTELSVLYREEALGSFYVDAMEILALRCLEYMNKPIKRAGQL